MWELFTGNPLFPGNTSVDMLLQINAVVDMRRLRAALHATPNADVAFALPAGGCTPLAVEGMPPDFVEFLQRCLYEKPDERASASDLLSLPYASLTESQTCSVSFALLLQIVVASLCA